MGEQAMGAAIEASLFLLMIVLAIVIARLRSRSGRSGRTYRVA